MMGSLFVADVFAKSRAGGDEEDGAGAELDFDEDAESSVFFSPARGNVVFASARDGWAFTCAVGAGNPVPRPAPCLTQRPCWRSLDQFAAMHAERLGVRKKALRRCLWGDYTVNTKVLCAAPSWRGDAFTCARLPVLPAPGAEIPSY